MILIGLGGNLPTETYGPARAGLGAALQLLETRGSRIVARSRWYEAAPVPLSDQPWFINAVVAIETALGPNELVGEVLALERELGRRRSVPNAARTVDLDLIAYDRLAIEGAQPGNIRIPHPRLAERAFVLRPLQDIAPDWRHPVTGTGIAAMLARIPADQTCRPIADADGLYGTEWMG